mgnify:CR=1 FL=1
MIFLSAFLGGAYQKAGLGKMLGVLGDTFKGLKFTYVTIICVVMTAKLMTYSGMTGSYCWALLGCGNGLPLSGLLLPLVGALGGIHHPVPARTPTSSSGPCRAAAAAADGSRATRGLGYVARSYELRRRRHRQDVLPAEYRYRHRRCCSGLEAYISEKKVESGEADSLRQSIQANVIMQSIAKYFVIYIVVAGLCAYFGLSMFVH